ncbi:MAG: tetratricopeptide repeat protein [Ignavibacteria bacterium]|jgi:tetratricopeptide (TPR) repeat protein|nr:tetratricopeptide repeat protein [Ignavibacteria bacterium]
MYKLTLIFIICFYSIACLAAPDEQMAQALKLMDEQRYTKALDILDEMLTTDPNNTQLLYNTAYCELFTGRADLCMQHLNRFLKIKKDDADVYNLQGLAYEYLGHPDSALLAFNQCIKLQKNYYEAYFNRGKCFISSNKFNEAKQDFAFAKKDKKLNSDLYLRSAELNMQMNFWDSALIDLRRIYRTNSNNIYYLSLYADAFFRSNKFDSAAIYYSKIIQLDSENVNIYSNRALCYDNLEQTGAAAKDRAKIDDIKRKVGLDPTKLTYKRLASEDNHYSIELPDGWRIFVRKGNDTDLVVFFNPEFPNKEVNGSYIYKFGGFIFYNHKHFQSDNTDIALRDAKFADFQQERLKYRQQEMPNNSMKLRKTFNPNEKTAREMLKFSYIEMPTGDEYYCVECYVLSTTGELVDLMLWIPNENAVKYEMLLDRILESLTINN